MNNRVVIIDDGICPCRELEGSIYSTLEFDHDKKELIEQQSTVKKVGHGTICALIIHKFFPKANIFSIKVLDEALHSSCEALLCALKWCENNDVKIINLSLGTTNVKDFAQIIEVTRRLYSQNKIIISAVSNENIFTLPACGEYSIGVCAEENNIENCRRMLPGCVLGKSQHELLIDGNKYVTPVCNSYAAAYISGVIGSGISDGSMDTTKVERDYFEEKRKSFIRFEKGRWLYNKDSKDTLGELRATIARVVCICTECSEDSRKYIADYFADENLLVIDFSDEPVTDNCLNCLALLVGNGFIALSDNISKENADYHLCEQKDGKFVIIRNGFLRIQRIKENVDSCCNYLLKKICRI